MVIGLVFPRFISLLPQSELYILSPAKQVSTITLQVAAVETEFLESLHESRMLAAQLDEKMDNFLGVGISLAEAPERSEGSARLTYHDTADSIQALLAVTRLVAQQDAECRQVGGHASVGRKATLTHD